MRDKDDIIFGSWFGIAGNVISFLCCLFGVKNELLWLCIVGVVVFAIGMLFTFSDTTNGLTNLLGVAAVMVVAHFLGDKVARFYDWFAIPETTGFFYFCCLLLMALPFTTILLLGAINIARD